MPSGQMDVEDDLPSMQALAQLASQQLVHSLLRTHAVSPASVELINLQLAYAT